MSGGVAMDGVLTCKSSASDAVRRQVEKLQAGDLAKLSTRRKGKLLVLDVGARITSANQKWMEVPWDEDDGIDMLVEFTDEDSNGIGKGLCLQLKAGTAPHRRFIPISRSGRTARRFSRSRSSAG